ncbi:MAG: redox-regulated ATPase YchF [Candidatus Komeilibacteria bacterium]|nr:redox-regulated ATPase YchF [Candidatus Komeilibacteria bacterium]
MSFSIGIVGLPNVGKSTLFRALTKKQLIAENFPFCTIDPNVGVVTVPDERLSKLAVISKSEKIVPTTIEFVDIAGLVKNAHKGEGLGNQFLAHIREVDAIVHVVRDFKDDNVIHVENRVDPEADEQIIMIELAMADLATIEKKIKDAQSAIKGHDKQAETALAVFQKIKTALDAGQPARLVELSDEEKLAIRDTQLLTAKPMLTVRNVSESELSRQPEHENEIIISAKIESEIAELDDDEAKTMLKELGLSQSGLDKLIVASYKLLNLVTFLTSGVTETRAWTVKYGAKAPQAAGVIHTDFEKGFIRAEIISYQDFVDCQGEQGARDKGKLRTEGKNYEMRDGDVCHFLFN